MLSMGNDLEHERMWNDDQSWAFPIPPVEENGGRKLIDSGKILMNMIGVSNGQAAAEKPSDKAPPPPPASKGKKKTASMNEGKRNGGGNSGDQELHIWTERERRKKMKNMFSNLHALIPHLHPRADKSTIIDEGVAYIKKLQLTLEDLGKLKEKLEGNENANPTGCDIVTTITQQKLPIQSREAFLAEQGSTSKQPPVTIANPNTILSGPESQAFFRTWTSPNVVLNICGNDAHINVVCSAKKPGILTAILFVMDKYKLDLVSAQVSSDHTIRMYTIHARVNGGPQQFPEVSFDVEETYKQAAAELMLWVDS